MASLQSQQTDWSQGQKIQSHSYLLSKVKPLQSQETKLGAFLCIFLIQNKSHFLT